jgi:hypothetical protein
MDVDGLLVSVIGNGAEPFGTLGFGLTLHWHCFLSFLAA